MYDIDWKIAGVGGMGAMGVGLIFSKFMMRTGYWVVDYNEYNSIIKGGHNTFQVRASLEVNYCVSSKVDLLIALDEYSLIYSNSLKNDSSVILCDWELIKDKTVVDRSRVVDVPFSVINKSEGGDEIMKNIIALGASLALIGADIDICVDILNEQFGKKGDLVVEKNIKLLKAGYNYILGKYRNYMVLFTRKHGMYKTIEPSDKRYLITGNEAIALSSVEEGLGFFAAYPMTPASSILHYLASISSDYNFVVKQTEDEIAAINSAIGASFAGARSMTSTSGGGFALMTEGLGLAAITETPIVVCVVSRPGPSTGMPTWTDQGDLRFVMHSSQGEFLRVVLTPSDPEECFRLTKVAFYLSEKYQIPVIILTDKYIAEGHWSCRIDLNITTASRNSLISQVALDRIETYERYSDTPSGITPRSLPGMKKGEYLANSDEHDNYGINSEDASNRLVQLNKRYTKKLARLISELPTNKIYGNKDSKNAVITFGSLKNQVLESMKTNTNFKYMNLRCVCPFPTSEVNSFLDGIDNLFVIENNYIGQLAGLIREYVGRAPNYQLLKDDGRPIQYEEILDFMKKNGY
ncbi:MAG: 2-oxoacid:acceptor oxidoreductase subunit alpha [bacterium]